MEPMEKIRIEQLMEEIQKQEREYEFEAIDEQLAMQMGIYIVRRAKEMGKPVACRISLNHRTLFACSMAGTKPESDNWIRRKENLVYQTNGSSFYWEKWCELGTHPFEWRGLDYKDYAPAGGSFPLRMKGADVVGAVTISGMASHEDHELAYETVGHAIRGTLGVDLSGLL